jgi:ATP-dependent helicase/nuclease subunit A
MINDATRAQIDAADPTASTWLSANAGSGKTRVLTDRVARLLLDGVEPQNILCLTYTKAAASEMQNRLFKRLGEWAMMGDAALTADLAELGVIRHVALTHARTLFARALETPGGLKIQTIHSFCAGVLRRFPLEAGVSPQFSEMEDRAAELLRAEVVDTMAEGPDVTVVDAIARYLSDAKLDGFTAEIARHADAFATVPADSDLAMSFGLAADAVAEDAVGIAFVGNEAALSKDIAKAAVSLPNTYTKFAAALGTMDLADPGVADLQTAFRLFLYAKPRTSKSVNFPQSNHRTAVDAFAHLIDDLHAWMDRTESAWQHQLAVSALDRTRALYAFATRFVPAYEARKLALGVLDFDDLIRKTKALLTDPAVAAWVLFRLDGGIDHILVDEAQDTSPDQWAVIETLAREFASGEGARPDRQRTIFVVGDKKQSIYSFQGADPEAFDRMQAHFDGELGKVAKRLNKWALAHSFRSSPAILRLVDLTFKGDRAEGLEKEVLHRAVKSDMPGRVDLWPAIAPAKDEKEDRRWFDPVDTVGAHHHTVQLASQIAREIERLTREETIPVEIGKTGAYQRRPITPGDFLILVRGRKSGLFARIIRACKQIGLSVAGADRLAIGQELAVKDIAALLRFLALPEDDLSLAAALRSPLFGWSEQQLFTLAHHRPKDSFLWQVLRDQDSRHPETLAILRDLRRQADFLRPYDLIDRILIRHGGRTALLARLGEEAEDAIDALLAQALAYERSAVPSLTGFLNWMDTDDIEIKRQMDAAGDRIRVMTVHGAKGLESPIVILPDTAKRPNEIRDEVLPAGPHVVWRTNKDEAPVAMLPIRAEIEARQERERRRLLYVGMTRAEKWLIVCAAGDVGSGAESWYGMVADGMSHAGAVDHDFGFGTGQRLAHLDWTARDRVEIAKAPAPDPVIPDFAEIGSVSRPEKPLAPTDLGGAKILAGDPSETDQDTALARGRLIHLLLEHLPGWPESERARIGQALVDGDPDAAGLVETGTLLADVLGLLALPDLAPLFGPDALTEVDVTAALPELAGRRIHGTIDRLVIDETSVLAIDFKSNRLVPDTPEDVPEGLLRQMGAYQSALAQIYPGKTVSTAILWTVNGQLMPLSPQMSLSALSRTTFS